MTAVTFLLRGVTNNDFHGTVPEALWEFPFMIFLALSRNNFTGTIPETIGNMMFLQSLDLDGVNFEGTLPESLWTLTDLGSLILSNTHFSGSILEALENLRFLRNMFIFGTSLLKSTIPNTIGNMVSLEDIEFGEFCTGTIPESIGNLENLQTLLLGRCSLEGTIPSSLSRLQSIRTLRIMDTSVTGTIPPTIVTPTLQRLYLNKNNLTGTIPDVVQSAFLPLVELDVSSNLHLFGPNLPRALPGDPMAAGDLFTRAGINNGQLAPLNDSLNVFDDEFMICQRIGSLFFLGLSLARIDPHYYDYEKCNCFDGHFWSEEPHNGDERTPFRGRCVPCPSESIECDTRVHVGDINHSLKSGFYAMNIDGTDPSSGSDLLTSKIIPCNPSDICTSEKGEFSCKEGHEDRLCSRCSDEFFAKTFDCVRCTRHAFSLVLAFDVFLVVAFIAYLRISSCDIEGSAKLQIATFYLQLLAILHITGLYSSDNESSIIESFIFLFGLESLATFSPLATECISNYDYTHKFWVISVFPVGAALLVLGLYSIEAVVMWIRGFMKDKFNTEEDDTATIIHSEASFSNEIPTPQELGSPTLKDAWSYVYFYLIDVAYFPITSIVFSTLKCVCYGTNVSFVQAAPWIECDEGNYLAMKIMSIVLIVFYVLGARIYFLWVLYKSDAKYGSFLYVRKFSFLWNYLKKDKYWWSVVVQPFRKISIACYLLFDLDSVFPVVIVFAVVFLTLLLQLKLEPYRNQIDNLLEIGVLSLVLIMYIVVFQSFGEQSIRNSEVSLAVQITDGIIKVIFAMMLIHFIYKKIVKCRKNASERNIHSLLN